MAPRLRLPGARGRRTHTFRTAGTCAYVCTFHPQMTATVAGVLGGPVTDAGA